MIKLVIIPKTAPEVTSLEAGSCANSFHNGSRSVVWCGGKCHDLGHGKLVECMGRDRPCSLGRIALTSVIDRQPPADLDTGREMRCKLRNGKSDRAGKRSPAGDFDRPEGEAKLGKEAQKSSINARVSSKSSGLG